jgi:hypothetical protein
MIAGVDNASQASHVTEPLMLTFNATVHYRVAMAPEELASAGLEECQDGLNSFRPDRS